MSDAKCLIQLKFLYHFVRIKIVSRDLKHVEFLFERPLSKYQQAVVERTGLIQPKDRGIETIEALLISAIHDCILKQKQKILLISNIPRNQLLRTLAKKDPEDTIWWKYITHIQGNTIKFDTGSELRILRITDDVESLIKTYHFFHGVFVLDIDVGLDIKTIASLFKTHNVMSIV